jgi:hypothetical protein
MWDKPRWFIGAHDPVGVPHYAPRLNPQPIPAEGLCDEPTVCIRINSHWASHVGGLLEALTFRDAWQGTEEEQEAACDVIEEIINMFACYCDDDTNALLNWHQNSATQQAIWQSQYDGSIESIDADAPDHFGYDDDDEPENEVNRQVALCYAVRTMIDLMCAQALEQLGDKKLAVTIIAGIIGIIVGGGVAGFLFLIASDFLIGLSEAPFQDAEARQNVACCITGVLADLPTTQNNLNTAADLCYMSPLQGNEYVIAQAVRSSNFASSGNFLAFVKTLAEGMRLSQLGILDPCPCMVWEHQFFGGAGNLPEGVYTYDRGEYDPVNDWAIAEIWHPAGTNWDYVDTILQLAFEQGVEVTEIEMSVELSATTSPRGNDDLYQIARLEPTPIYEYAGLTGPANHGVLSYDPTSGQIDDIVTQVQLRATVSCYTGQGAGKYARITHLRIAGVGFDPFEV